MSLEAARSLCISDLIQLLNEKLDAEWSRLLDTSLSPMVSIASVKSEVRSPWPVHLDDLYDRILSSAFQIERLVNGARNILGFFPTLWNRVQPANRLPQELIPHIAQYLLLGTDNVDATPVIPLTHVCRHWRESIISTPSIWALISNNRTQLMALSLERAKAARLHVRIDMRQLRESPGSFGLIIPYIQNIRTLHVCDLSRIEELTHALPNFPRSTPNLQSLTLLCTYTGVRWDQTVDPFEPFPHTLKHFSLFNIPLYPSLLNVKTLTDVNLRYHTFDGHMDTILTFLEHNRSLERATMDIRFVDPSLRHSRRQAAITNKLQHLSISCNNPMNAQALISNIALQRGAHLEICSFDRNTGLNNILSGISTDHLSNLLSPAFLEYRSYPRSIRLHGRNGSLTFSCHLSSEAPCAEFPLLSLAGVREFRFEHRTQGHLCPSPTPLVFNPSSFPALETLAVECNTDILHFLSDLLSNPSALPALKTLAFLNCAITEDLMEKLAQFASDREGTTLARLYHVVIVHEDGRFPSAASIHALGRHVAAVDVRFGTKLPTDLSGI